MDVTTELLKQNQTYSASDNTNPDRYSSSRSLNYATGASISKAELAEINVVPFSLQYSDAVGLFGVENHFIKVKLNIIGDIVLKEYLEPGYIKADINFPSFRVVELLLYLQYKTKRTKGQPLFCLFCNFFLLLYVPSVSSLSIQYKTKGP